MLKANTLHGCADTPEFLGAAAELFSSPIHGVVAAFLNWMRSGYGGFRRIHLKELLIASIVIQRSSWTKR